MPFCFVLFPGIYLKRNIPVKTGKELNPIIEKIWSEYFNVLLEEVKRNERKKIE